MRSNERYLCFETMILNKKTIIFYWLPGLLLLLFVTLLGENIEGDFGAYKAIYGMNTTHEPIFAVLNQLFAFVMPFELFFFIVGIWQIAVLRRLTKLTNTNYSMFLLSLLFLAGMGWAGHWRQSIAVCVFAYLGLNYRAALISSLTHFGFLIASIFYIFRRNTMLLVVIIATAIYYLQTSELLHSLFYVFNRERFLLSIIGVYNSDNYFEHRNLWDVNNLKIWLSLCVVLIVYMSRKSRDNGRYFFLVGLPYLIYLVLGFDAYLAQKGSLSLAFLAPFGVSSLNGKYAKASCGILISMDLASSSFTRFLTLGVA